MSKKLKQIMGDKNGHFDQNEDTTSGPSDNETSSNITLPEEGDEVMELEDNEEEEDAFDDYDDENNKENSQKAIVSYLGTNKNMPVLNFRADGVINKMPGHVEVATKLKMTFKQGNSVCRLVRNLLEGHGFKEVDQESLEYNLCWMGSHVKPLFLSCMQSYQRVNHFPRSFEITRKDKLYKNVQKMQSIKGVKNFDFVPQTFVLPAEFPEFSRACKDRSTWIVKPTSLSRGRGIFLTTTAEQCMGLDKVVACKYIPNPFLINGFKFDIRLYVAVTSFDPLVVYLYEEGLTRFATVQFDKSGKTITNTCMHLTNYSVNKRNNAFVSNTNSDVEDEGSKWTLGALLRHLKEEGHDTTLLMMSIEDVIIKTMLAGESGIMAACKTFLNFKNNCFELFGFDILLDENLKPWVLEVNLSPSLSCDAPLDLKIKSNMLTDLFNLVGVECHDPTSRKFLNRISLNKPKNKVVWWKKKLSVHQKLIKKAHKKIIPSCLDDKSERQMEEERRMLLRLQEEYDRRGNWVRLFPTETTQDIYGNLFLIVRPNNIILHQSFFPGREGKVESKSQKVEHRITRHYQLASQRCQQYERRLPSLTPSSSMTSLKVIKNIDNINNAINDNKRSKDSPIQEAHSKVKQVIRDLENLGKDEELREILLLSGFNLSYIQARKVFTAYLEQMMTESFSFPRKISDNTDALAHLLRRKGSQMCHGFVFREPRNFISLVEKRAAVESQLHKFLAQFKEETTRHEKNIEVYSNTKKSKEKECNPDDQVFRSFLEKASLPELELVFNLFTEQEMNRINSISTNRKSPSNKDSSPKEVKGQKRSSPLIEFCEALIDRRSKHVRSNNLIWGSRTTLGERKGLMPCLTSSSSSLMSAFNVYGGFNSCPERPKTLMLDRLNFRVDQSLTKTFEQLRIRIGSANPRLGSHPLDGSHRRINQSDGFSLGSRVKSARNFSAVTSKTDFPTKKSATRDKAKQKTDSRQPVVKPFTPTTLKCFKQETASVPRENDTSTSGYRKQLAHKNDNCDSDEEEFLKFESTNHKAATATHFANGNRDALFDVLSNQHKVLRAWYDSDQSQEGDVEKDGDVMASLKGLSIKRSSIWELTPYLDNSNNDLLVLDRISASNAGSESKNTQQKIPQF